MKRLFLTLTIGTILSLSSCGEPAKKTDEGEIREQEYFSKEIGWTIEIPQGWEIIDLEETKESAEKGLKLIEKTMDQEIDNKSTKNLIRFQNGQFNIFQSTSEPFKEKYEGEFGDAIASLKTVIHSTYTDNGVTADTSATTVYKIDGLDFYKYSFTIYGPKGEPILKQIMYSRLINGLAFNVNINYNNKNDRDVMLKAFKNSKFTQRR